ncbi:hypothetical protein R5M74_06100 [Aeromonas hydrophila]|nr:hypothetical protein R5M74_06100 [Aeromonas hydrophila]
MGTHLLAQRGHPVELAIESRQSTLFIRLRVIEWLLLLGHLRLS